MEKDKRGKEEDSVQNVYEPLGVEILRTHQSEAASRIELDRHLRDIFSRSREDQILPESEANLLYEELNGFIKEDPDNNIRIILYLPFNLLPDLNKTKSESAGEFAATLREGFIKLLFESDVRANFDDGDVLEPGIGIPKRTRKAAHLLPEFLSFGLISENDAVNILKINKNNAELTKSILEGMVVADDKGLINHRTWDEIESIGGIKEIKSRLLKNVTDQVNLDITTDQIVSNLNLRLAVIEKKYSPVSDTAKRVSQKRIVWEKGVKIDEAIEISAQQIALKIVKQEIDASEAEKFGVSGIRGIVRACELVAKEESQKAQDLIEKSLPLFRKLWEKGSPDIKNEIKFGANHLEKLNALPEGFLAEFGIDTPDLSLPLPVNIYRFAKNRGKEIAVAAKKIKENPELSKYIYPFILVFGSKIKGYDDGNGDFDAAIFVKPEVSWKNRGHIISLFNTGIPELKNIEKVLEFWVGEKDGEFSLNPKPEKAPGIVADEKEIHFILGGIWIGDHSDLQKLRTDLTAKYLNLDRFGTEKNAERSMLLRQLESDMLQYRIMHKGYKRYYPSVKVAPTKHSDLIDWKSDFWDSGFRRIATLIFLNRVFLP